MRRIVWYFLFGWLLLETGVNCNDEDCVEGEEGCGLGSASSVKSSLSVERQSNILVLTDENFSEVVKEEDMIMATFVAPWCHHCHNVLDVFGEAALLLEPHGVTIGKLDIETNKETKKKYQIKQVPDVRIFRKGVMYPYEGPGDVEGVQAIVDFMIKERRKDDNGAVLKLTEDNFDNILQVTPLMLVEFYAEWCPPCQALEPHFFAAARRLKKANPPVLLGQVQIPDQIELAKRFTLTGYPLLIIFRYGKEYNYTGPREEEGIVKYMLRNSGPSSIPLNSEAELNDFVPHNSETRVVGFLMESDALDDFIEAGNHVKTSMELGHCSSVELARNMGFSMGTVVVFHARNIVSKYEDGYSVISSLPKDSKLIANLLLKHATPLVGEMTKDNQLTLFGSRPLLVAYFDVDWDKQLRKATMYWHALLASVAKDFQKQDISFAIANEGDFPTDIKILGLEDWGEDVTVGIFAPQNIRYPMKEELYQDSLREFIRDFLGGSLEPYLRSEPTPRRSKAASIQTVVGTSFSRFMNNPSKASLVKLCMAESNGCEEAEGHFEEVVIRYEGSEEVVFGEMNVALNDVPVGTILDGDLPAYLFSAKGSRDLVQISPKPADETDIMFFLKYRNSIRPTVSDRELERRDERKKKEKKKRQEEKKQKKEEL